jgi:hypothetical protein
MTKTAFARRDLCNIAQVSNDSTALMIKDRTTVDATDLAIYLRTLIGQFRISQPLAIELSRRFVNLDRKKQVDGTYLMIDGARSLTAWLEMYEKQIGSKRNFYYVRDGGKKPVATEAEDARAILFSRFADKLAKSVRDEIADSVYSYADKRKIVGVLLNQLVGYGKELALQEKEEESPSTVPQQAAAVSA